MRSLSLARATGSRPTRTVGHAVVTVSIRDAFCRKLTIPGNGVKISPEEMVTNLHAGYLHVCEISASESVSLLKGQW
jgi:hypothetical protein